MVSNRGSGGVVGIRRRWVTPRGLRLNASVKRGASILKATVQNCDNRPPDSKQESLNDTTHPSAVAPGAADPQNAQTRTPAERMAAIEGAQAAAGTNELGKLTIGELMKRSTCLE